MSGAASARAALPRARSNNISAPAAADDASQAVFMSVAAIAWRRATAARTAICTALISMLWTGTASAGGVARFNSSSACVNRTCERLQRARRPGPPAGGSARAPRPIDEHAATPTRSGVDTRATRSCRNAQASRSSRSRRAAVRRASSGRQQRRRHVGTAAAEAVVGGQHAAQQLLEPGNIGALRLLVGRRHRAGLVRSRYSLSTLHLGRQRSRGPGPQRRRPRSLRRRGRPGCP